MLPRKLSTLKSDAGPSKQKNPSIGPRSRNFCFRGETNRTPKPLAPNTIRSCRSYIGVRMIGLYGLNYGAEKGNHHIQDPKLHPDHKRESCNNSPCMQFHATVEAQ